jgi:hypothetical protein
MKKLVTACILLFLMFPLKADARSGCCSSHSGVRADGCGCKDGTLLSSACAPYYTCNSGEQSDAPVQQAQQAVQEPIYTPIPTKVYVVPTSKPTQVPSSAVKPTKAQAKIRKAVNKIVKATPTLTPKKSFWRLFFNF